MRVDVWCNGSVSGSSWLSVLLLAESELSNQTISGLFNVRYREKQTFSQRHLKSGWRTTVLHAKEDIEQLDRQSNCKTIAIWQAKPATNVIVRTHGIANVYESK